MTNHRRRWLRDPMAREIRMAPCWFLAFVVVLGWIASSGMAAPQDDRSLEGMPWYDSDESKVQSVPLKPLESSDARHRDSDWIYVVPSPVGECRAELDQVGTYMVGKSCIPDRCVGPE